MPATQALGLGILAWSPLGRGVLTGKYRSAIPADSRAASDHLAGFVEPYLTDRAGVVVDAVATAAEGLGVSSLDVALGWVLAQDHIASAIVGARTAAQLGASLGVVDSPLPQAIVDALNEVTQPHVGYPERR